MPVGDRYVAVPGDTLFAFLGSKGFEECKTRTRPGREVVYRFDHKRDARYTVYVYTSCTKQQTDARALGTDAIRVVAVFEPPNERGYGVYKQRVYRTGTVEGVLERTLKRMREAYDQCTQRINRGR